MHYYVQFMHFCVHFMHFCVHFIHFCVHFIHFCVHFIHFCVHFMHFCVHFMHFCLHYMHFWVEFLIKGSFNIKQFRNLGNFIKKRWTTLCGMFTIVNIIEVLAETKLFNIYIFHPTSSELFKQNNLEFKMKKIKWLKKNN